MTPNYMDLSWKWLNINTTTFSIQCGDNLLTPSIIINTSLYSWRHTLCQLRILSTKILPIHILLCKLRKKTKYLVECLQSYPGRFLRGSPCIRLHLIEIHPDTEWEWLLPLDRLSGFSVKDSDGVTESSPYEVNLFPQYPPHFPHQQRHKDRLPWIQTDPAADDFNVGGHLWELLSDGNTNTRVTQKPENTLKGIRNPIPRETG